MVVDARPRKIFRRLAFENRQHRVTAFVSRRHHGPPPTPRATHGIAGITKALSNEWAKERININAIAPGYIATDNTKALREDANRSKAILERIPEGRWGRAEDIAGGCVFLASGDSDYLNGAIINIDGGWLGR